MYRKKLLFVSANRYSHPYPVYPLGVSYLFAYLSDRLPDHQLKIFDFNLQTDGEFTACLQDYNPDYVALSLRNIDDVDSLKRECFVDGYQSIVAMIRQTLDVPLIIGGSAFSIYPRELFSMYNPDYGIQGEGEESLRQLLISLGSGIPDLTIEGLVYRNGEEICINSREKFIKTPQLDFDPDLLPHYWSKAGMVNIQTKRGCPYHCIYCTYPLIEGSKVRTQDPGKIIETLRNLYDSHQIDHVFFTDSVFNISNVFNVKLAKMIIASKLPIRWGAYFSPHNLSLENLRLFADAGLTHIEFGTESLSDSTLKHYGKKFSVADVVRISDFCDQAGIYFCHFMIIGGYGETEASVDESFENSRHIENTVFFPYIGMRIYPGTILQKKAIRQGVIRADDDLLKPAYYLAPGINYETLRERAAQTGRRWVFPDEDLAVISDKLRSKNRKGSLWHYLKQ